MKKLIITCLMILVFLLGGAAAMAQIEGHQELIKAVYQDIKIIVNGRLVSTPVEPFQVEEGHLMVPARVIGEALGCLVEWDPVTKVVYISEAMVGDRIEIDKSIPLYVEQLPVLRNVGPFFQLESRSITIASRPFNHGLIVELVAPISSETEKKQEGSPGYYGETVVELNGKYAWLEGYLGVDDETRNSWGSYRLEIYGDDLLLYQSDTIKPADYPRKVRVNVQNVHRLSFVVRWLDGGIGDYDRLWAALADLQVN